MKKKKLIICWMSKVWVGVGNYYLFFKGEEIKGIKNVIVG